ncbi:MAG: ferrous iron transport protein A [Bacilli bacterium]|jgi:ferrous iron transport protein A|nr:ferrous iron transport protein A [Bacilli bacterium]MBQ4254861.1 ferrous iron transport protein A [Bacilli bacterium]
MPIFLAPPNEEFTIVHVHGVDEQTRHLRDIGLVEGAKVRVLSKKGKSVIVALGNSRIALDSSISSRIMVG